MLKRLFSARRSLPAAHWNDEGIRRWGASDLPAAQEAFRRALKADPSHAGAASNLGALLLEGGREDEALALLAHGVDLAPDNAAARVNLANGLVQTGRLAEGAAHLREALRLDPGHALARRQLLRPLLDLCEWEAAAAETDRLVADWQRAPDGVAAGLVAPFTSLFLPVPGAFRLEIARRYAARVTAKAATHALTLPAADTGGRRLRVGYVSADFSNHATAHLAAGLFERHDRERFELYAYSFGPDDGSEYRRRTAAAFEHFADVRGEPAHAIAARIARDGIQILVDLKGYTTASQPEIFALRPAPVQMSYLGYPGTTGAPWMDYVVADRVVLPEADFASFDERAIWLPASYQANDDRRPVPDAAPAPSDCGLPGDAFVFCAFNQHAKINAAIFAAWLRVLDAVPGSVLWLLAGPGEPRLRAAAAKAGVDPARLVFAARMPMAKHLARHGLAGVFLDTDIYNAHTSAADALWADLPVLTMRGASFAGRVAESLLWAVGLSELVADDVADYERRAVSLARAPHVLRELRTRLEQNRVTAPLFDTRRFARGLEAAFEAAWARHVAGGGPAAFAV
jgi:predicted O-linked N-acetylglucosamine transferase (SPINDLY family)